ncbi:hypothetical protein HW555_012588 [Spodoptera exigua]|uniref:Uncharacterized protein n=1 Tax=Spodoptera exigua TaxID=7107 RepID=A0A835G774_SPOEX|nr:hypothetical protein HW555_012588 [Spodoptera exigua]
MQDFGEPAERVGCGGMHRIVLLMAVLTRAIAPFANVTGPPTTEPSNPPASTMMTPPPTVFRNLRVTSKPRKMKQGKVDSPMLNYIFDSYATSNKHFHDK